jgi:hypothetical protein
MQGELFSREYTPFPYRPCSSLNNRWKGDLGSKDLSPQKKETGLFFKHIGAS